MPKIVIIGAGSLVFSSRLTADILSYGNLSDSHFALVDIDQERLDLAEKIVKTLFDKGSYSKATVSSYTDRKEALKNADYVIISILVGGFEAIKSEIDLPAKYGIDQCIGDTLTPGGVMRCLRTLPVLTEMTEDIHMICPEATVLNYTNPMGMLSKGILDSYPDLKYIGLCHSVQHTAEEWAKRLDLPLKEIDYKCGGINHEAWFTSFRHGKTDLLPKMRKLALKPEIWHGDSARMEYLKHFGYPVTESSGHVSEYNPWFRKNSALVKKYCNDEHSEWNGGPGFIKTLYERPDWKEQMEKMANWENPIDLRRSTEYGSIIIHAIESGVPAVVYGNVKNKGYIDNLPWDALVEVPCLVDANGIQPVRIGKLPHHLAAINSNQLAVQELAVEAVHTGDPELVFQAMAMDPLTGMSCTLDEIRTMTIELMKAHEKWIPQFKGRLPKPAELICEMIPEGPVEKHNDSAYEDNE
ncbi:MAG: alpha-galactosidase [Spirochaetales bacterium]|nr:alpha-galactosidase [Spirochaetales bacterium]